MGRGINKNTSNPVPEKITLQEVSDKFITFDSARLAGVFLGVAHMTLESYASIGRKIIKSPLTGKLYIIKKSSGKR